MRFRLKQPWPDFMTFYATPATGAAWIVPKKYVEKVGDEGFKKAPVGAGPYRFVSFKPGVELVMEAHERLLAQDADREDAGLPGRSGRATRLAALKRGEIDIAYGLVGAAGRGGAAHAGLTLKAAQIPVTLWLVFADQGDPKSPWADRRVRLAANLAIDRKAINEAGYLGLGQDLGEHHPADARVLLAPRRPPTIPPAARQLLAEAGYPQGFDGGDLLERGLRGLRHRGAGGQRPQGGRHPPAAAAARARRVPQAVRREEPASTSSWSEAAPPATRPRGSSSTSITGGLYTYGGYPEVDGLFNAQAIEVNPRVRRAILEKMQQIIHERVLFGPMLEYAYLVSIGPRLEVDNLNVLPRTPIPLASEELRLRAR